MFRFTAFAAAALMAGSVAQAATISVSNYTPANYNSAIGANSVVEDFEDRSTLSGTFQGGAAVSGGGSGELAGLLSTAVGTFGSLGGVGTGSTCSSLSISGGGCSGLGLQQNTINGQGNITPIGGTWALNSNDTLGMQWDVALADGKSFKSLVFALRDAGDAGQRRLTVTTADDTIQLTGLSNNNLQLFSVDFGASIDFASIRIETSRNDGFTFDGAAVAAVPLPASVLLLLGGLGVLGASSRRRAKKLAV